MILVLRARHLPLPGRRDAGAGRRQLRARAGRVLPAGGAVRPRQVDAAARRLRARAALPRRHASPARVTVAGLDTREHGPAQLGALVGVLFQDPETQLVMSSVRAELALGAGESRPRRGGGRARGRGGRARARASTRCSTAPRTSSPAARSSGSRSARRSRAGRRLVLLDEPTSQLDPVAGDELIGLLRRLNEEWETTIVLAEHRLERCLAAADRVIALEAGRVAHDGDPDRSWHGPRDTSPPCRRPARSCSRSPG